ncbi:hypothetical protein [Flagellimonas meishanensis]|uniref:hypothetical protein n=1 Tax=Flagellimonas meishanensis TaxID=2873264 RepID=UPI001CA74C62|nr:hypothetical protein [[Muricauda] meishanensis]
MKTQNGIIGVYHWGNKRIFLNAAIGLFLFFLCSCESSDGDMQEPDLDEVGFNIDVSGSFSRDMEGTNATYKFNEMPSSFVTTHQLAIYLTDGEGYTVTATILLNGASLPTKGKYNITDFSSGTGLQELDAGLIFGQNGGVSHNSIGSSIGSITLTETGNGFVKGTLVGALLATGNGSGSISINGSFHAEFIP